METQKVNLFIHPELWRALRMRALEERTTATDLLNRIIAAYVGRKVPTRVPKKPKRRA